MFTVGWGNLVPRNHRRFSLPVEFGFIYTGAPRTALSLQGSACDPSEVNCLDVNSIPMCRERNTKAFARSTFTFCGCFIS
jgi:hypothetical protein